MPRCKRKRYAEGAGVGEGGAGGAGCGSGGQTGALGSSAPRDTMEPLCVCVCVSE
jgi:hypothetical protein